MTSDVRYALRRLRNAPTFAIVTIATLSLGSLAPQRFTTGLLTGFAAVALLLASVGIFGVISFSVTQRTSEIGVRLAFGASPAGVTMMVMRDAAMIVALGAALGCALAALLGHLVTSLLFATKPLDAPTYASVLATLLFVAGFASYLPARRAARTDPAVALRES
jgi:ABC-type antimicrobial peptide transport system permease subunit